MQKIYYAKAHIDYKQYLADLNQTSINKIASYCKFEDRSRSFISEWFKSIVITNEVRQLFNNVSFSIKENSYKRPYLAGEFGMVVDFNVSHSRDYVIIALSVGAKIGVDIEFIDPIIDYHSLSREVFSETERNLINSSNEFFNLWSKKESLIKAIGTGFLDNLYIKTQIDHDSEQIIYCNNNSYQFKKIVIDPNYACYCCLENNKYDDKISLIEYDFSSYGK